MKVEVLTGPQGAGKSRLMLDEIVANPGLYFVAAPTITLIAEHARGLFLRKPSLRIYEAHSDAPGRPRKAEDKLYQARRDIAEQQVRHAVVITTHETLMKATFDQFEGWHARIDEAPAALQAGRLNIAESRRLFEEYFSLRGVEGVEWAEVSQRNSIGHWKSVKGDSLFGNTAEFLKQAAIPGRLFARTQTWKERDTIDWFSLWTPKALSKFASVTIAGSSYTSSVGYKAIRTLFELDFEFHERRVPALRTAHPSVIVRYFAEGHHGSTSFWSTSEGRNALMVVENELSHLMDAQSFWSGNGVVQARMEHRFLGDMILPGAAGLNEFRNRTRCAFISSSKALPEDAALKEVFGLSDEDIRRSREDDAIAQFALRGAIRNPDYGGDYEIIVYERAQAERLAAHLSAIDIADVTLAPVDTPLLLRRRVGNQSSTRDGPVRDIEEKRAKDAKRKRDARESKAKLDGRQAGKVGRPRRI